MLTRGKYYLSIMVLIIFGSGLLLFGWHALHGRNLGKPPKFDLSKYEDTAWYTESMDQAYAGWLKASAPVENGLPVDQTPAAKVAEQETGYVYFRSGFCQLAGAAANDLIKKFLQNYPPLDAADIELLSGADGLQYCARVKYAGLEKVELIIDKFKKDYSDVVFVP